MRKKISKKPPLVQRPSPKFRHEKRHFANVIPPLPVWCHPEFHQFLDDYLKLVNKQINTFKLFLSISDNPYSAKELAHWTAVKKGITHLRWMGTRRHDS